jgi:polysaccharide pyruvyl transferase WcaK-like protein
MASSRIESESVLLQLLYSFGALLRGHLQVPAVQNRHRRRQRLVPNLRHVVRTRSPRVALVGLFGAGNHGNDASLLVALEQLRRVAPTATPVVVCASPDIVMAAHDVEAVPIVRFKRFQARAPKVTRLILAPLLEIGRWLSVLLTVGSVDVVLVPGTGILDDFGCGPLDMPYHLFRWTMASRLFRRPVLFLSVGAGPILHPLSRWLFLKSVSVASSCSFRDQYSLEYMRSIGRDVSSDRIVPDLVFSLPLSQRPAPLRSSNYACVGLGVMAYYGWNNVPSRGQSTFETYLSKLVEFVEAMIDRGHVVRLLVGDDNDARTVAALRERVADRFDSATVTKHLVKTSINDLSQLVNEINQTDVVVATRYHNVIGALISGRPVVSIGYAEKNRDLLRRVGLAEYCQDVDDFDVARVIADTETLLARRQIVSPEIIAAVGELGRAAAAQFDEIPWPGTTVDVR